MTTTLGLQDCFPVGWDLVRCEGVMAAADGAVWAADGRGFLTRIGPDGKQRRVGRLGGQPNGVCFDADGRVIVANLAGSVQRVDPESGRHDELVTAVDGRPTRTPNFPFADRHGRIWISNSSDDADLARAFAARRPDGFLFRLDGDRATIVAEDLWFPNGVAIDADERHVYVAESSQQRVRRLPVRADGTLGAPEPYGPDLGTAPDGIAFDEAGNLWVACPGANEIGVITPDRRWHVLLADRAGRVLREPTNVCFGGEDRRVAYVGNLPGPCLIAFRVPTPGLALVHQLAA